MDWNALGPAGAILVALGGAIRWLDARKQRSRDQMIEALKYRLQAEQEDHAETEEERDKYRDAYRSARKTLRSYEQQLIAAGIVPDPTWEEPDV